MSSPSISVVLPAFNEEGNLVATVADAMARLIQVANAWEIIIVDDGSTDRTNEIARMLCTKHGGVRLISHSTNRGYGAALRSGFGEARYDLIFLTDSDGQFSFDHLAEFVRRIEGFEAVIGRRTPRADAWHRLIISDVGNRIARTVFKIHARDIDCAFKLFRRQALQALPLMSDGTMISTDILTRGTRAGWRIMEVPVPHRPRRHGSATGANPAVILRTVIEYVRLWRNQGKFVPGFPVSAPQPERPIPFAAPLPD